jgi:Ca-activated chloride channel family protein
MSPVIENKIEIQKNKGYAIGLLLDISRSMNAPGYVNKFAIVKRIVRKFIKKRQHDQMGIVVFADFAYVASPLTYDKSMLLKILDNLKVGMAGNSYTAIYDALFFGAKLFKSSNAKSKIIILLTDGENNTQTIPFNVSMRLLRKYGIKVYTIGIGANGDFNKNELVKIAKDTGGKFFAANSKEELQKIYANIDKLEKSELKSDKFIQKNYLYPYPLFLALISLLLYLYLVNKRGVV